jgi:hypothetical protein
MQVRFLPLPQPNTHSLLDFNLMKQKVYISGKMTGLRDLNFPKFEAAEKLLRENGYEVVNPHKIHPVNCYHYTWHDFMRNDIKALVDCHIIAVLDDWKESRGAIVEVQTALSLDIKMICAHTLKVIDSADAVETSRIALKYILKSVKREIQMRKVVYRSKVMGGTMKQEEADHEIRVMEQIYQDYKDLKFLGATTAQPIQKESQGNLF